jgi:hypothetical protein
MDSKIVQKINYVGNNAKSLYLSVEASLKKLRTSYIDLLYVHWWDWDTSIEEVMDALHILVQERKVLYLVRTALFPFDGDLKLISLSGYLRYVRPKHLVLYNQADKTSQDPHGLFRTPTSTHEVPERRRSLYIKVNGMSCVAPLNERSSQWHAPSV